MHGKFDHKDDFYKNIGVDLNGRDPRSIDEAEIKKAFRASTSKWHESKFIGKPEAERAAAEAMMKKINAAKTVLLDDPAVRESYHQHLSAKLYFRNPASSGGSNNHSWNRNGAPRSGSGSSSGFGGEGRKFRTVEDILREIEEELAREDAERAARRAAGSSFSAPPNPASSGFGSGDVGSSTARSVESEASHGKTGLVIAGVIAAVAFGYALYRKRAEETKEHADREPDQYKRWTSRTHVPEPTGRML